VAAYHNSPASTRFGGQKNAIEFESPTMSTMVKGWDFRLIKGLKTTSQMDNPRESASG
jgi:hypothetical protein